MSHVVKEFKHLQANLSAFVRSQAINYDFNNKATMRQVKTFFLHQDDMNFWLPLLSNVNMDDMVSVKGSVVSLFHESIKIEFGKKEIIVKTPKHKGALYNEMLDNEYLANNALSFFFGKNSENNLIGLLSLGLLVNASVADDNIFLPHTKQAQHFALLKIALTTKKEDYVLMTQALESENELELMRQYNEKLSPLTEQFTVAVKSALLNAMGLDVSKEDSLTSLAKLLEEHCKAVAVEQTASKLQPAIVAHLDKLTDQINKIKAIESDLVGTYVTGFYKAVDSKESLQEWTNKVEAGISEINPNNVNYTKFHDVCFIENDFALHQKNWLGADIEKAIKAGFDPLKVIFKAFGVQNVKSKASLYDSTTNFEIRAYGIKKAIAMTSKYVMDELDAGHEVSIDSMANFARGIVIDIATNNVISEVIAEYMTVTENTDNYTESSAYASEALTIILRMLGETLKEHGTLKVLKENPYFNVNGVLFRDINSSDMIFHKGKEVLDCCEAAKDLTDILVGIRKIVTLEMIELYAEREKPLGVKELNCPESIEVQGITFQLAKNWNDVAKIYKSSPVTDGFIVSANTHFLDQFAGYGVIYTSGDGSDTKVFVLEAVSSNLQRTTSTISQYIYDLRSVSGEKEPNSKDYQLGFELKHKLTNEIGIRW